MDPMSCRLRVLEATVAVPSITRAKLQARLQNRQRSEDLAVQAINHAVLQIQPELTLLQMRSIKPESRRLYMAQIKTFLNRWLLKRVPQWTAEVWDEQLLDHVQWLFDRGFSTSCSGIFRCSFDDASGSCVTYKFSYGNFCLSSCICHRFDGGVFSTFLQRLALQLDCEGSDWRNDTLLVLDGAKTHRSEETRRAMAALQLPVMIAGPYGFDGMPAETVFSLLKAGELNPWRTATGKR